MATETEGKWFWEKDGVHCGAMKLFFSPSATYLAVCDLPQRHEGMHSGERANGFGGMMRVTWDDRSADKNNRHYYRELVRAFNDVDLPYEDGI